MCKMSQTNTKCHYLPVLRITNTHGIDGEMKAELLCDSLSSIQGCKAVYLGENGEEMLHMLRIRQHGIFVLLKVEEVTTVEQAAKLKTKMLYAQRTDIQKKEEEYFIADLIGLPVFDATTTQKLGILKNVLDNPANQIYEITTGQGTVLFPVIKEFIARIDPEVGIFLRPIPGFFNVPVQAKE